jgi:hypothetical protein
MTKNTNTGAEAPVNTPATDWTDDQVKFLAAVQLGIDRAVATDAERARFVELDGPAICEAAPRKSYRDRLDRDRYYPASVGVSNTDESVRALVRVLRSEGVKVFAVSALLGIPAYAVSAMPVKGAAVPAEVPAEAPAA